MSANSDDPENGIKTNSTTDPPSSEDDILPLPDFTSDPIPYSGCCFALSRPLLTFLHSVLPSSPNLILSIGSGYGLLEAALLQPPHPLHIIGTEVQPSPNKYLPPSNHHCVSGSRFLDGVAAEASAWLFVYPRRVGLVNEYLAQYGDGGNVNTILWIGPRADWEDYKGCFGVNWNVHTKSADEVGGRAWELIAIATKVLSSKP